MAPRIIESDDESEFDQLSQRSESSQEGGKKAISAAAPSKGKGKGKAKANAAASASPAAGSSASKAAPRASGRAAAAAAASSKPAPAATAPAPAPVMGARPAARRAAIKANESMDVDGAVASDEDERERLEGDAVEYAEDAEGDEDDDGRGEEQDDEEEEEDEDAAGSDDYDDEAEVGNVTHASPAPQQPMKLKFKMGQNTSSAVASSSSSAAAAAAPVAASPTVISLKGRGSKTGATTAPVSAVANSPASVKLTVKGGSAKKAAAAAPSASKTAKRKHSEMSDLEDDDDDDLQAGLGGTEEEEDDDDFFSDSGESVVSLSKMTARQRAAHIGAEPELMELPQAPSKKKILTEDEVAMRKVETSRRRKHLLNKKLEEEKTETIERLLKKPIGRRAGASTSRIAAATKVDHSAPVLPIPSGGFGASGVDENGNPLQATAMQQLARVPTEFRWISSVKDGDYRETWAVPPNYEDKFTWPADPLPTLAKIIEVTASAGKEAPQVVYPPPRPPPQTRRLKPMGAAAAA